MSLNVIRIDRKKHVSLLADHKIDPVTKEMFQAGDEVVVCAKCKSVYMKDVWLHSMREKCCNQSETASSIENYVYDKERNTVLQKKNNYIWLVLIIAIGSAIAFVNINNNKNNLEYQNYDLKNKYEQLSGQLNSIANELSQSQQLILQYSEKIEKIKGLSFRIGSNNSGEAGGFDTGYSMYFEVFHPIKIKFLYVRPNSVGNITVMLCDYEGNLKASKTVYLSSSYAWNRINLDFEINDVGKYYLTFQGDGIGLWYNVDDSSAFNYSLYRNDVLRICGSGRDVSDFYNEKLYQYFYEWHYSLL